MQSRRPNGQHERLPGVVAESRLWLVLPALAPHGPLTSIFQHIELAPIATLEPGRPENPLTGASSNL